MATGTRAIATRADANRKARFNVYTSDLKRCVTKSSAISAGFTVSGTYASNQLVKFSDLTYSAQLVFKLTIDISSESKLYNKGPITLDTMGGRISISPLSYAREVEATEIVHDASGIPLEYSIAHNEESTETNMTLSTVDEVLQVVQEFEEQDQILGATLLLLGMNLTRGDDTTNLLDSSTYGPVLVVNKKVTFTLLTLPYTASNTGVYKLSYPGTIGGYLKNNEGLYPHGALYAGERSDLQYQTYEVNGPGTWEFTARWVPGTIPTPDPSTPTRTYKVRVRIQLVDIAVYSFRVGIGDWTIYGSAGIELGSGTFSPTEYRPEQLPADKDSNQLTPESGGSWYYIEIWSGTTMPIYIDPGAISFSHRANNMAYWNAGTYSIVNDMNIYYGYALNQGYSTTIYNFDLKCSGQR